ncbi:probable sugar phosphate/phosphate translocator At1g06470 [Magnolia sinica]|uniref:probable sugar phosphate/phosphate translocator At1g06470 n=1 Tax=Magnolia sinica TaxID=86752 RepID=UPI002657BC6C|nr:probable sugar phosphate/phosphate translocator At1g06470 [Magnolia sinica]
MTHCTDGVQKPCEHTERVQAPQSSISTAALLRTLFYILVWYTFSTCLTLYNKTLLGDKLGKFPAPFLMNTIHFGMQAILSKAIVRFWSQKLQPGVKMSWRDYFLKVVPTAIGTALDINLSNVSLVFISVTFATMCKSASPIFLLLFALAFK